MSEVETDSWLDDELNRLVTTVLFPPTTIEESRAALAHAKAQIVAKMEEAVKEARIDELKHLELAQDMNKSTPIFATTTITYRDAENMFPMAISLEERIDNLETELAALSAKEAE